MERSWQTARAAARRAAARRLGGGVKIQPPGKLKLELQRGELKLGLRR